MPDFLFLLFLSLSTNQAEQPSLVQIKEAILYESYLYNQKIEEPEAHLFADTVQKESGEISIPIILAVIEVESRFDKKARSKKNCRGLMQLSFGTAKTIAKRLNKQKYDIFGIQDNIILGVRYLSLLLEENKDLLSALTIYNKGWKGFVKGGYKPSGYARLIVRKAKRIKEFLNQKLICKKMLDG